MYSNKKEEKRGKIPIKSNRKIKLIKQRSIKKSLVHLVVVVLSDVHPERGTHPHQHWNNVPHTGKGSSGKRALKLENPQIADSDSDVHAHTHARSRTHIEVACM